MTDEVGSVVDSDQMHRIARMTIGRGSAKGWQLIADELGKLGSRREVFGMQAAIWKLRKQILREQRLAGGRA